MSRLKHRPNRLDPLVLLWLLQVKEGKSQPRCFPRRARDVHVSRRAVYYAFERLRERNLVRRTSDRPLTYEIVEPGQAATQIVDMWQMVEPPKLASPAKYRDLHKRMRRSHVKASRAYDRLRKKLRARFEKSIDENKHQGMVGTRKLFFLEKAEEFGSRIQYIRRQDYLNYAEEVWKPVPYLERPKNWIVSKPLIVIDEREDRSYGKRRIVRDFSDSYLPIDNPNCEECGTRSVFHKSHRIFICPKCGLEVDSESARARTEKWLSQFKV